MTTTRQMFFEIKCSKSYLTYLLIATLTHILIRTFCSLLCSFVLYAMVFRNHLDFECFVPSIRLLLKTGTYLVTDFTALTYFISNLDSVKFSQ